MVEASLFEALMKGDDGAMQALLASDPALARARDPQGVSILLHTLYQQRPEWTETLIARLEELGDDLDLFEAAALGRTERLRSLIADDPELVHLEAGDGFTALHLAAFFCQPSTAAELLEAGADSDKVAGNPIEVRPLHSAVAAGCLEIVEAVLERGCEIDARQAGGFTPLMGAAAGGNVEIVSLLLDRGANPELYSDMGQTAAALAMERGHEDLVGLLGAKAD